MVDAGSAIGSLITTIGHDFGSLVYVPEVGVFLNSSMVNFDPRPDRPNSIAPKMPSSPCPPSCPPGRRAFFAAGGSGGYRILSGVVHAFVRAIDLDLDVRDAVDTPRTYCQGQELFVDARVGTSVQQGLADRGHRVVLEETIPGYARSPG